LTEEIKRLMETYKERKTEIANRIREFQKTLNQSDERIFAELCFCICTPQTKATLCWEAISTLIENSLLYAGKREQLVPFLKNVRFYNNKAEYILEARKLFTKNERLQIKKIIKSFDNVSCLRAWLKGEVKGIGIKEASHFLRNIGLGRDMAILDRHILKNLKKFGVIEGIPKNLPKKAYDEIESKMRTFSRKIGIPLDELDLLLWSMETGMVFK
jgi:N-glycosylase/DNA lyase